jgi:hypothetical protein
VFGVGLGNIHLYAAPYIPAEFAFYLDKAVFVAKSGALRIVSELGVLGLGVFLMAVGVALLPVWRQSREGSKMALVAFIAGTSSVIDYLLTCDGPTYVFLFLGIALAVGSARVVTVPDSPSVSSCDSRRRA